MIYIYIDIVCHDDDLDDFRRQETEQGPPRPSLLLASRRNGSSCDGGGQ